MNDTMNQLIFIAKETWNCVKTLAGVIIDEIIYRVKVIIKKTVECAKSLYQSFQKFRKNFTFFKRTTSKVF